MSLAAVRRWLASAGVVVHRVPPSLARRPTAELRASLPLVVAHHAANLGKDEFFFVQVGAFDGRSGDPIHRMVRQRAWRGVLVEPQRDAFESLVRTYAGLPLLELRNVAVSDTSGPRELFKIGRRRAGLPDWIEQVASLERSALLAHAHEIPDIEALIEIEIIQTVTFAELLEPFGPQRISLLQVDAEGYDDEVVKLFHDSGYVADIISFEHKHLDRGRLDACFSDLISRGYRLALDGPDTIAYREATDEEPGA